MNLERLMQEKRQEIFQIAARQGVRNIRVFGSAARGEAGEGRAWQDGAKVILRALPEQLSGKRKTPFFGGSQSCPHQRLLWR